MYKRKRHVLIVGGNSDIGQSIALSFLNNNDNISLTYNLNIPKKESIFRKKCFCINMNLENSKSVNCALESIQNKFGPIEIIILNSGITCDKSIIRMQELDFTNVVNINLIGAFRVINKLSKNFIRLKKGLGRIIFISSIVGYCGSAGQTNYAASKSGIVGFARSLVKEFGSRRITVNVVLPGYVETKMTSHLSENIKKKYLQKIPIKQFAEVKDVANVVFWLASKEAKYISGALIPVDGGLGMGH